MAGDTVAFLSADAGRMTRRPAATSVRALVVDVTDGTSRVVELDDRTLREHIGGAGLGVRLLTDLAPGRRRPARAGRTAGLRLLPAGRHAADHQREVRRGRQVAPDRDAHRRARVQPLRHRGQAHRARRDRRRRPGGPAERAARRRRRTCGSSRPTTRSAGRRRTPRPSCASGSAARSRSPPSARRGSGGVRYATLSHDGRHAGRGGLGAVLGAKNVKAVAVRPRTKVAPADPAGVLAAAKDLRARSFGAATAKYRELGTLANLLAFNALSTLPTRNFQAGHLRRRPGARRRGAGRAARHRPRTAAPPARSAASTSTAVDARGGSTCGSSTRTSSRSARCAGSSDPDDVLEASARCDELGIDTISAGRHHRLGDGVRRARPDRRPVAAVRRRRARCCGPSTRSASGTGLGPLLALGSRRAAERGRSAARPTSPRTSRAWSCPATSRGTLHAMALGLAVNARGADHNRSGAYEADLAGDARPPRRRAGARRGGGRDRGPRGGHGLADPVQVPPRRLRPTRSGRVGPAARRWSPAGTSTPPSCGRPPAGSCWPSARTTCARDGARGRLAAGPAARGDAGDGLRAHRRR